MKALDMKINLEVRGPIRIVDVVDWLLLLTLLHCAFRVAEAIEAIAGAFL